MLIPAKDVGGIFADIINDALADMPDDETRRAVLEAFSKQMFCGLLEEVDDEGETK